MAVPSQRISNFLHALGCCLNKIGGTPALLVPDNLKSAVVKADRYESAVNRALEAPLKTRKKQLYLNSNNPFNLSD